MPYTELIENGKATQFKSGEEAAKNGAKGGIASGISRRRKKTVKDAMDYVMSLPVTDAEIIEKLKEMGVEGADNQTAVIVGLMARAMQGDPKACALMFEVLDDASSGTDEQTASHNSLIEAIRKRQHED